MVIRFGTMNSNYENVWRNKKQCSEIKINTYNNYLYVMNSLGGRFDSHRSQSKTNTEHLYSYNVHCL